MDEQNDAAGVPLNTPPSRRTMLGNATMVTLLLLAGVLVIHFARPILLPIAFAMLLQLILRPIYNRLRWLGLPDKLSAAAIVLGLLGMLALGVYYLTGPAGEWINRLPRNLEQVEEKLREYRAPMARMTAMAERIDRITTLEDEPAEDSEDPADSEDEVDSDQPLLIGEPTHPEEPPEIESPYEPVAEAEDENTTSTRERTPVPVRLAGDGVGATILASAGQLIVSLVVIVILLFFMLSYGSQLRRALTRQGHSITLTLAIGQQVSSYLFTISVINACLGLAVGTAMWLLGMPNPLLWGVLAALLNFVPYLGAITGVAVITMVAALTYEEPGRILIVPVVYFLLTSTEGNFITPMILGERFTINPIFIFIWLLFWGWIWGIPGAIIAVPMLMAVRIVCDHYKPLMPVAELISLESRERRPRETSS